MQSGQSTHARGTNTLDSSVLSTLSALGTKAEENPKYRFRSLARLLDRQLLGEAFRKLKRRASPGIDGVTQKWLNRRSQRKSFTVASFVAAWERWQLPDPQVNEKPWPRTAGQNQPKPV